MEEIAQVASRLLILSSGALVADGAPKELLRKNDLLQQYGLLPPVPTQVVLALRKSGWQIPAEAITVPDAQKEILFYLRRRHHEQ